MQSSKGHAIKIILKVCPFCVNEYEEGVYTQ